GRTLFVTHITGDEFDVFASDDTVTIVNEAAPLGVAFSRVRGHAPVRVSLGYRHEASYSGMFPCFLAGCSVRLPRRPRSALMTARRVPAGSSTLSSSPRSAARNGLATL